MKLKPENTNPPGFEGTPTFGKRVKEAYRHHENFKTFFFERVMLPWHFTQPSFEAFTIKAAKHAGIQGKISQSTVSMWQTQDDPIISAETIEFLSTIFDLNQKQKIMLYKVGRGIWVDELEASIAEAELKKDHGPLMDLLCRSSGFPATWPDEQKLRPILRGDRMDTVEEARRILKILNPEFSGKKSVVAAQNKRIMKLLLGQDIDIDGILDMAEDTMTPGRELVRLLASTDYGVTRLTYDELAALLSASGEKMGKVRVGNIAGVSGPETHLNETQAETLLDKVTEKSGVAFSAQQRGRAINILTGTVEPSEMIEEAWEVKERSMGKVIIKARQRKGVTQEEAETASGAKDFTLIENGQSVRHKHARMLADWLGLKTPEDSTKPDVRKHFLLLAMHVDLSQTADEIMDAVMDETLTRREALTKLYDMTTMTRSELAAAAGLRYHDVTRSLEVAQTGRISGSDEALEKLADICGLKERHADFVTQFKNRVAQRPGVKGR